MADEQSGEKSEQPSQKKLDEAHRKGQFAKSAEVQTAFVLLAAMSALSLSGAEMWHLMADTQVSIAQPFARHPSLRESHAKLFHQRVVALRALRLAGLRGDDACGTAGRGDSDSFQHCHRSFIHQLGKTQPRGGL